MNYLHFAGSERLLKTGFYMRFFITCPKGLESLLEAELLPFGADEIKQTQAGVQATGDLLFAYKACLWSRLANRVLLMLGQFPATTAEELYEGVHSIDWLEHLRPSGTLAVDFNGLNNGINNTHFGALKVKDGIVDFVREKTGSRPSIDKARPDLRVNVHLRRDSAQISIDLSGDSLHRRGYRQQTGAAPLKENLAAALLARAGWTPETAKAGVLVDPMCGSGTFLTEAAMIAADIAPGLLRKSFGFDRWLQHQTPLWHELRSQAQSRRDKGLNATSARLIGVDADAEVLKSALANAERLGVDHLLTLNRSNLSEYSNELGADDRGLIITNPPYGERLGETSSLRFLYRELGEVLKREFAGWNAAVFTSNPELGKIMGLRADKIYKFFNGPLAAQLLIFSVYQASKEQSAAAAPEPPAALGEGAEMLENRLRKNIKALAKWVKREQIEAYRVYDADIPEYAVAIDRYADQLVVQEYAAPASIDPVKAFRRLQDAISVVAKVFEVGTDKITLKERKRQQGKEQYERQSDQSAKFQVREHGCLFEVNLRDFIDTGLFLDHRPVRYLIQSRARGKRVLNLFCYTATATVHAALGGATQSLSIDMSATYIEWARRNYELNGMDAGRHQLQQADCVQWLEKPKKERFDLIFMDPPTFSNSKRMAEVLDVQRDHVSLIKHAMSLLEPEGLLIFSNNYRKFKIDSESLADFVITDISKRSIDPDFKRNTKIHSCFEIRHSPAG